MIHQNVAPLTYCLDHNAIIELRGVQLKFRKSGEAEITSKEILKEVTKREAEELENLLMQIETKIGKSADKDLDLLMAKTMITSRLASFNTKNV